MLVAVGGCAIASGARPRLVCSSTPVALITGPSNERANTLARVECGGTLEARRPLGDGLAGEFDADRVGQPAVGHRPRQRVDARRSAEAKASVGA